jgi:hypothetical protein
MLLVKPSRRRLALLSSAAALLTITACGTGEGEQVGAGLTTLQTSESTPPIEGSTSTTTDGEVTSGAVNVAENLFPDIDVVEVSTGASLNLKQELSGGDRPVLLWFWAPH